MACTMYLNNEGKALAWALRTNKSLTSLDISICQIDCEDVINEIAKALNKNVTLTSLYIHYRYNPCIRIDEYFESYSNYAEPDDSEESDAYKEKD
ncbi:2657_t:CDS:2 [Cetraspora pellucida]|uniref:2657_t:CDS:1 n=1 Tax=Cetraspora pellucida TaxID=1433469 RepID=A0A9N9GEI5_9GLOM|nr:2657_t:CDS:2 [Cetraspora pellucida]